MGRVDPTLDVVGLVEGGVDPAGAGRIVRELREGVVRGLREGIGLGDEEDEKLELLLASVMDRTYSFNLARSSIMFLCLETLSLIFSFSFWLIIT